MHASLEVMPVCLLEQQAGLTGGIGKHFLCRFFHWCISCLLDSALPVKQKKPFWGMGSTLWVPVYVTVG